MIKGGCVKSTALDSQVISQSYKKIIKRQIISRAIRMRTFYLLLLPAIILLVIFNYVPMYGILLSFKDYNLYDGIMRSPWNNFEHFKRLFDDLFFYRILFNTFYLSILRIVFSFPAPIILALLLNEIGSVVYKKVVQTISYLPHFISWVILAGILSEILSPQRGIVGYVYSLFGREPVNFLVQKSLFRGILVTTGIWQGVGWGTIIYLAALSSIDPGLYESASIDGANRFQKAIHITIPSLIPVMTILFILTLGGILRESFGQIFNLYNPLVYKVADVFSTYIYRMGIEQAVYDYTTAIGLFQNIVGVIIILLANTIIKRYSEYGIW
jgi:putative aldouronate transport system permease protein